VKPFQVFVGENLTEAKVMHNAPHLYFQQPQRNQTFTGSHRIAKPSSHRWAFLNYPSQNNGGVNVYPEFSSGMDHVRPQIVAALLLPEPDQLGNH
jgi:hypothetical protein